GNAIAARYAFVKKVEVSESPEHASNFGSECRKFKTVGSMVTLDISTPDRHVFGAIYVYVEKLANAGTGYTEFAAMIKGLKPSMDDCGASKMPTAYIESGDRWITITGRCLDGGLFRYEVGEVLLTLGKEAPKTFLLGVCGGDFPDVTDTANLLADLQKPHTFW